MNLYDAYLTSCDRAACRGGIPEGQKREEESAAPAACPLFPSLAMVYAPHQAFRLLYDEEEALMRGTLFRELDKPLEAGGRR